MTSIERVQRVLAGQRPDRPPFSFWSHFAPDEVYGPAAVWAHLRHLETYQLDFLKVMDDNPYPHSSPIEKVADLASLVELTGQEESFSRQLDLLADLKRATGGRVWMSTTIFNAWMMLRMLLQPPKEFNPPEMDGAQDGPSRRIREFYAEDPDAVTRALHSIGVSLSRFAARCLQAGADGIFLSVRDDWVDVPGQAPGLYQRIVRPTDLAILDGASAGRFNILHVCGRAVDFRAFAAYPVHVINWADRSAGPSISQVKDWLKPAICAGIENLKTLPEGMPEDVANEVADALGQAGERPIMIAPGCTYDPHRVPPANLRAISGAIAEYSLHRS